MNTMSIEEWSDSKTPFPLLACLRGPVRANDPQLRRLYADGVDIYSGLSPYASFAQYQEFVDHCLGLWREVTSRPLRELSLPKNDLFFGPNDLYEVARLASSITWNAAYILAAESIEVTCKDETKEDRWYWGFGGPPDPLWNETVKNMYSQEANFVRAIFDYPKAPQDKFLKPA